MDKQSKIVNNVQIRKKKLGKFHQKNPIVCYLCNIYDEDSTLNEKIAAVCESALVHIKQLTEEYRGDSSEEVKIQF